MNTFEEHILEKHPLVVTVLDSERATALHAWNSWRSTTDLDQISNAELTVIPMVYQRWKEDPAFAFDERIIGVARKSFFQTSMYLKATDTITGLLFAQSIPYRLVHDSLIYHTLSQNTTISNAGQSLDLWIPHHIDETVRVATALGWRYERHFRLQASFINDQGLRLNIYQKLSKHWTTDRHERFFTELSIPESRTVNCIVELLLLKYPNGQPADLQSIIDLYMLLQRLSEKETRDLIQLCQYYLLSYRLSKGLQILNQQYGLKATFDHIVLLMDHPSSDQLAVLESLFQKRLQHRSLSVKYVYHRYRNQIMRSPDTNLVAGFYRYWHMQRLDNKKTREWIISLKSSLRLK